MPARDQQSSRAQQPMLPWLEPEPEPVRTRVEIAPGAVHVPDWLTRQQQSDLVRACRGWAAGPVPIRHPVLPTGNVMSVQTVCLGWHWSPYRYTRTSPEAGGVAVARFPDLLLDLGRAAVLAAYGDPAGTTGSGQGPADLAGSGREVLAGDYTPDAALINFYDDEARMGMHQDKDERGSQPVVSLSLGSSCVFRFGNTTNRNRPYTDVELRSGDLFVFGGPSRFAFHGVTRILPGTADPGIGLSSGRLNLTLRTTGLEVRG